MADGDHLENWSKCNNAAMHSPIMIKFGLLMRCGTPEAIPSSKAEPKVEINRQRPQFWISFSLNISAAEQNIFTEFGK